MRAWALWALLAGCGGGDTDEIGLDTDGPDTDVSDTDTEDTDVEACADYDVWSSFAASCGGQWAEIWLFRSLSHPYDGECPLKYGVLTSEERYDTVAAALSGLDCATECVYTATGAADVQHCGYRGGYTYFTAGADGQIGDGAACGGLIYVSTCAGVGWAADWDAYVAAYACEDHEDTCPPR